MFEWHKKEKPVFTGITRGIGGFGFGGGGAAAIPISATGGDTVFVDGGYKYHVFTTVGPSSFDVISSDLTSVDYLVVGGGGSGGPGISYGGGGGGAGGFATATSYPVSLGSYAIQVGYGGATPESGSPDTQNNGNPSFFSPFVIAYGGGTGGTGEGGAGSRPGIPGGSGGGGGGGGVVSPGGSGSRITTTLTDAAIIPQGNNGEPGTTDNYGGPGGGAGAFGNAPGNAGGIGKAVPWVPPSYGTPGPTPGRWFAGGGAGGYPANPDSDGGGGGSPDALHDGLTNTGGGGGGAYTAGAWSSRLGHGGPGIVIVRYSIS